MKSDNPIVFKSRKFVDPKEYMRCPNCNFPLSRTTDVSAAVFENVKGVGRTRACGQCGHRWRTLELTVESLDDLSE